MSAEIVLNECHRAGVKVGVSGDKLNYSGQESNVKKVLPLLAANKLNIIKTLNLIPQEVEARIGWLIQMGDFNDEDANHTRAWYLLEPKEIIDLLECCETRVKAQMQK